MGNFVPLDKPLTQGSPKRIYCWNREGLTKLWIVRS